MKPKKKIIILIPYYLPGNKIEGSLTSTINLVKNLSKDFSFAVLTSDRDVGDEKPYSGIEITTWIDKEYYKVCYIPKNLFIVVNLIKQINKTPHDVLYLTSFFDPIFSISIMFAQKLGFLKAKNIIVSPKGEAYEEALNFKKRKKSIYLWFARTINLYKNVVWHASTEEEKVLIAKNMKIQPEKIRVAINMASLEDENNSETKVTEDIKSENCLRVVFLSRISKDKNIIYTFEILGKIKENIIFDLYQPIVDEDIWAACLEKIKTLPTNIQVNYKGSVDKKDVKRTLRRYDLMFLPTFAENFGHAIAESLIVGTPVLISDNTPWRGLQDKGIGWDLSLDKPELFIDAIHKMATLPHSTGLKSRNEISSFVQKQLSDPEIYMANKNLFNSSFS